MKFVSHAKNQGIFKTQKRPWGALSLTDSIGENCMRQQKHTDYLLNNQTIGETLCQ
jgi:hypothetical protein